MDTIVTAIRTLCGVAGNGNNLQTDGGSFLRNILKTFRGTDTRKIYNGYTIPQMITTFNLQYSIVNRATGKIDESVNITTYNSRKCKVSIKLRDLLTNDILRAAILEKFNIDIDANELVQQLNTPEETISDETTLDGSVLYLNGELCPIIELEEREKFSDGDKIFEVEFRGDRSPDDILLKAMDVANIFDMKSLLHVILETDSYIEGNDYVILNESMQDPNKLSHNITKLAEESNDYGKNHRTFLTWYGFHKVIFASRSGNEYRTNISRWIVNLTYTHALGSMNERQALAAELSLYRVCLNQMCGVYLIRIGKISMLRGSMKISIDQYPADEFDNTYVYKFGRSNDILRRYKEHCSNKGYGRFSETIQLTWFVITDAGQDVDAENSIKSFFDESHRRFEFVDDTGKQHDELIILRQNELSDTNMKYQSLIARYHNSPNEIALIMDKARSEYAVQLSEANLKISEEQRKREVAEEQIKLLNEQRMHDATKANHKIEISEMKRKSIEEIADLRIRLAQFEAKL